MGEEVDTKWQFAVAEFDGRVKSSPYLRDSPYWKAQAKICFKSTRKVHTLL